MHLVVPMVASFLLSEHCEQSCTPRLYFWTWVFRRSTSCPVDMCSCSLTTCLLVIRTALVNLSDLTFVQIDEFFPKDPKQTDSFIWYVREFYLDKDYEIKKKVLLVCSKIDIQELVALQLQHISSVYGASVPEVLLDLMTNETRLERVDLLMDLGTQLNAAVHFGQVQ